MISARTKAALPAAKARGVKMGNPHGARYPAAAGKGNAAAIAARQASAATWRAREAYHCGHPRRWGHIALRYRRGDRTTPCAHPARRPVARCDDAQSSPTPLWLGLSS